MNTIVVYPGRFHPFHLGHKASYDWLINKFGQGVYIATSDVQNDTDSPFRYQDKVKMMTKLGIPASHIVKTRNPYQVKELVDQLNDQERQQTAIVFALSEKDAGRLKPTKADGSPSYLQPIPDNLKRLKPMTQQGYYIITPTVNFKVKGEEANSASEIRRLYQKGNDSDRANIITDLYGAPDPELIDIFNSQLARAPEEVITYGTPIIDGGTKDGMTRESRINRAKINQLRERIKENQQHKLDYIDEKNSR